MDRHSEVEVKFRADSVTEEEIRDLAIANSWRVVGIKTVSGTDTYYEVGGHILRYRQGDFPGGELTYKKRKSEESILDRIEINLPFSEKVQPADVHALLVAIGAKETLVIDKKSYIIGVMGFHRNGKLERPRKSYSGVYHATLALYDVYPKVGDTSRFLEIEIDSSSDCSAEDGGKILAEWTRIAQHSFHLAEPLNSSLFELYSKGTQTK